MRTINHILWKKPPNREKKLAAVDSGERIWLLLHRDAGDLGNTAEIEAKQICGT